MEGSRNHMLIKGWVGGVGPVSAPTPAAPRGGSTPVLRGSVSVPGARRASFFDHSPLVPVFAPTSTNNLEYLLTVSKNLAHPLHPVYDNGKGGGWMWWE